ncbi:MAG: Ig-like domain-containing protein [bacterium]
MRKISYIFTILALIWIACSGADTEAPNVDITAPTNGSIVSGTVNISIGATDSEAVERVELYINDTLAATFTTQPYSHTWITDSLPNNSSHGIFARAYDTEENKATSPVVTVTVFNDTTGPSIFIWDYDELDVFYDPDIDATVDCSYWIEQTLLASGHTYTKSTILPTNLNDYDIVFVTLGWLRC